MECVLNIWCHIFFSSSSQQKLQSFRSVRGGHAAAWPSPSIATQGFARCKSARLLARSHWLLPAVKEVAANRPPMPVLVCLLWGRGANPKLLYSESDGDAFDVGIGISTGQNIAKLSALQLWCGMGEFWQMAGEPPKSLQFLCKQWKFQWQEEPSKNWNKWCLI